MGAETRPDAPAPPRALARHAVACLCAVWLAAWMLLLAGGRRDELFAAPATLAGVLLFAWLVVRSTRPAIAPPAEGQRRTLWAQLVWLALVIGITAFRGLVFHGVATGRVPIWDDVVEAAGDLGERWLAVEWVGSPRLAFANPTAYFALPLTGLLLL